VRYPVELDRLVTTLEAVDAMTKADALDAFASYVRVRTNVAPPVAVSLPTIPATVPGLIAASQAYGYAYSEHGRVGQALVAGALDVVFNSVKTTNVYASSKRRPGDVRVETGGATSMAVEVKQKTVNDDQVSAFARQLERAGVFRGMYVAMGKGQKPLAVAAIAEDAVRHGVALSTFGSLAEFLAAVVGFAQSIDAFLEEFPQNVMRRLLELGASDEVRTQWASAVASATPTRARAERRRRSRHPRAAPPAASL
jgi:hypothetical protein